MWLVAYKKKKALVILPFLDVIKFYAGVNLASIPYKQSILYYDESQPTKKKKES